MQVTYRYRCDVEYSKVVIDRQYRQGSWLLRLPVQFGIVGAICALFLIATIRPSWDTGIASFFVITSLTILVGVWVTKQGLMMKFMSRPGFGSELAISLTDAGIEVSGESSSAKLEWSTYPNAVRFHDGVLLKRQRSIRWLPDAAITTGSPAEAAHLIASKSALRTIK